MKKGNLFGNIGQRKILVGFGAELIDTQVGFVLLPGELAVLSFVLLVDKQAVRLADWLAGEFVEMILEFVRLAELLEGPQLKLVPLMVLLLKV